MRVKSLFVAALLGAATALPASPAMAAWFGGEFSANITMSNPKDPANKAEGKIFIGNQRARAEGIHKGETKIIIGDWTKHTMTTVLPDKRQYHDGPGDTPPLPSPDVEDMPSDPKGPCANPQQVRCQRVGQEKLNGVDTESWDITMTQQNQQRQLRMWVDPQKRIVIKVQQQGQQAASMERKFLGMEKAAGRDAEKWEITMTGNNKTMTTTQWVDPKLRAILKVVGDKDFTVELSNLQEGPQPANLFEVPQGYQKVNPPQRPGQPGQGGPGGQPGGPGGGTYR